MKAHIPLRRFLVASALAWGAAAGMGAGLLLQSSPAHAIPVFDSANYAQNLLTAARTLQQINQQIQRSEEHTSELQSLMRISYAVFCLKKKKTCMKHTTDSQTGGREQITCDNKKQ